MQPLGHSLDIVTPAIYFEGVHATGSPGPMVSLIPRYFVTFLPRSQYSEPDNDLIQFSVHTFMPTEVTERTFSGASADESFVGSLRDFRDALSDLLSGVRSRLSFDGMEGCVTLEFRSEENKDIILKGAISEYQREWIALPVVERERLLRSSPWRYLSRLDFEFLLNRISVQTGIEALNTLLEKVGETKKEKGTS